MKYFDKAGMCHKTRIGSIFSNTSNMLFGTKPKKKNDNVTVKRESVVIDDDSVIDLTGMGIGINSSDPAHIEDTEEVTVVHTKYVDCRNFSFKIDNVLNTISIVDEHGRTLCEGFIYGALVERMLKSYLDRCGDNIDMEDLMDVINPEWREDK